MIGPWTLAAALAAPDEPSELQATSERAARIIEACRDQPACEHDREVLGEAFLAQAVAAAVLRGEIDATAAANARALVPQRATLWRDLLSSEGGPEDAEPWVRAWIVAREAIREAPPRPQATIRGRVAERGSGRPVRTSTLTLDGEELPLGVDGTFEARVPIGEHTLAVEEGPEHGPGRWSGVVDAGEGSLELWIDRVVPQRPHRPDPPPPALGFSAAELSQVAGSLGDPLRALQSLPSMARPESLEGDLVFRGGEAVTTGVRVDGIPLPYLRHFLVGRSVIDPSWLESITLHPGGMPAHLGGALGAVVDAHSQPIDPDPGVHGRIRADALDASLATEGRLGRGWVWAASARNAWPGTLFSLGSRGYGLLAGEPHLTLGYTDYRIRVSRPTPHGSLSWTALGAQDTLALRSVESPYDFTRVLDAGFHRLAGRWSRQTDRGGLEAWLAAGPDHQLSQLDNLSEISDTVERIRLGRWQTQAHLRARAVLAPRLSLSGGAEALHQQARIDDFTWAYVDPSRIERAQGALLTVAGFTELGVGGPRGSLTPGLRVSGYHSGAAPVVEAEPRLTLDRVLGRGWRATASAGRHSQAAPPERLCCDRWTADQAVMTAWQAQAVVQRRLRSGLVAQLSAHGWRASELIVKDLQPLALPDGPFWEQSARNEGVAWGRQIATYPQERGQGYGAELLVRLPDGGLWSGWLGSALGRSERWGTDGRRLADRDLPWSASAALTRQLQRRWQLSGQLTVSAGDPYTPEQPVYVVGGPGVQFSQPRWDGLPGARNTARFYPYGRLDLRASRSWIAQRSSWAIHLDVFNLLNVPNPVVPEHDVFREGLAWPPDVLTYAPVLPNLGLEVSF